MKYAIIVVLLLSACGDEATTIESTHINNCEINFRSCNAENHGETAQVDCQQEFNQCTETVTSSESDDDTNTNNIGLNN